MQVLVIGQENFNTLNTTVWLKRRGHQVLTAVNGKAALPIMKRQPVDVVLLDAKAARHDGYKLYRRLANRYSTKVVHLKENNKPAHQLGLSDFQMDPDFVRAFDAAAVPSMPAPALALAPAPALAPAFTAPADNAVPAPNMFQGFTVLSPQTILNELAKIDLLTSAWVYLGCIAFAEIATATIFPQLGFILHALVLLALLLHTVFKWDEPVRYLLLSLSFIPLIRILSLGLPLAQLPLITWHLAISVPLLLTAAMMARTLQLTWSDIGLNTRDLPFQGLVGMSGLAFGYIGYQLIEPAAIINLITWPVVIISALTLLISTGVVEEVVFRGFIQFGSDKVMGSFSIVYTALLYAIMHIGHQSWAAVVFAFGIALLFSGLVRETRSILGVTLCHGITNLMIFIIMPIFA